MDRALIFSDLHAHAWSEFSTLIEYRGQQINSRLADCAKVIDWVRQQCRKHDLKHVIFAGDLFHKKRVIDVPVFNVISAALFRLAKTVDVTVMAGNHDLTRRSAEGNYSHEHALYALSGHPKIHVIDTPTVVEGNLGLVPYGADRDTTLQGIEAVMRDGATWACLHAGVAGAVTGPVEYQPYEPVTMADLDWDGALYSGHYHQPQTLQGKGEHCLTYIGAPLELVRGDGRAKRGAILVDLNNPHDFERLRYKGPRFLTRQAWDLDTHNVDGHFVDLQLRDTSQAPAATQALMDAGARAVHHVFVSAPVATQARLQVKVQANGLPTVEQLCQRLVETAGGELDQTRLWLLAQEALHAADTAET